MLREISARQVEGDYPRRWFVDDYFDLMVWLGPSSGIFGFQLCYDKEGDQRAVTWREDRGFAHDRVDTEDHGFVNPAPVLVPLITAVPFSVKALIEERSADLPAEIREVVLDKISEILGNKHD
jgi:hypothetical protein